MIFNFFKGVLCCLLVLGCIYACYLGDFNMALGFTIITALFSILDELQKINKNLKQSRV